MSNQVIEELAQLAPRIRPVLEAANQAEQTRSERLAKAQSVLAPLNAGLETIADELAATMGAQVAVGGDSTATDRSSWGSRSQSGAGLEWSGGCRLTLLSDQAGSCSLECVGGARLYADGQLQLVASHFVNQQEVWFGERVTPVSAVDLVATGTALMEELNAHLPAAMRQFSDRLPA